MTVRDKKILELVDQIKLNLSFASQNAEAGHERAQIKYEAKAEQVYSELVLFLGTE